jgi:2-polyprenyl-6-methoxyphenol hydroxylase-like FAD-dependent oxidoreductase
MSTTCSATGSPRSTTAVRAILFGNEPEHVRHLGTYLAFWTMPNHLGLQNWALAYDEPNRSAGIRPIHGNREAMAYLAFQTGEIDYDYRDVERHKDLVRELAAGMGWQVPEMIARMADAPDFYFDSCSQVLLDSWSRGRIGLLGDAAFCPSPLTGQGTSLAIVGAYVLAGELAAAGSDHAVGLINYERYMRDWVSAIQKAGQAGADGETWLKLVNAFTLPDYN